MAVQKQPAQIGYGYPNPQKSIFPDPQVQPRDPSTFDRGELGQIWVNYNDNSFFILTSIAANVSNWVSVSNNGGTFNFINLPPTDASGNGIIYIGGAPFLMAPAVDNTFVGIDSGSNHLTGSGNTGYGNQSLNAITSGDNNSAFGAQSGLLVTSGNNNTLIGGSSGDAITSGSNNSALGFASLSNLLTGTFNIAIGDLAGSAYNAAQSSNIVIGNAGVVGDSNVIRIGTDGAGSGDQDACFIAGVVTTARSLISTDNVYVSGDVGVGIASTVGLSNVTDVTQGVGVLSILSTDGNSGDNAGFIKIYVGTTVAWIPYFTNIAP